MNKFQLIVSFVENYHSLITVVIPIVSMLYEIIKKFHNTNNIHKQFIYKNKDKYMKYEVDTTKK